MLYDSEMSVYDLKDHPDFQYRPGTVVIRVANFTGEDAYCTAGQVHTTHALSPKGHLRYSTETPTFYQNDKAIKITY
jgi:hypothetical protein